jgi:NNP family nitrate/nitrite transporter-like MFS transporter
VANRIPLFNFSVPRIRILHHSWIAFFITFLIWFASAPLMPTLKIYFHMTGPEVKALLMLNVALTIPARVLIGVLVDKVGPRKSYTGVLFVGGLLCLAFAAAQTYQQLAILRFLLGFVGAGFVVGIRLIAEWFPAKEVGFAEGIYGGWGNLGAAVVSMTMPFIAFNIVGGADGWRAAIAVTGLLSIVYSFIFYRSVRDTPEGSTYFRPMKSGGLEVTTKGDFLFYVFMTAPLYLVLAFMAWRLSPAGLKLLTNNETLIAYLVIAMLTTYQYFKIWHVNKHLFVTNAPVPPRYQFKQVAILNLAYMACFGSELAVISMLPQYFIDNFGASQLVAGFSAGCFAVMNIFARPGGGYLSDAIGRRKILVICLFGQTIGYVLMSQMGNGGWSLPMALGLVITTSIFVQGACGAVYSIIPLIQRRMTGQIAGMAGAYGNVGGVLFLTVFSMVSPTSFFYVLAATSTLAFVGGIFISEPRGHMIEVHPDGRVERIAVQ